MLATRHGAPKTRGRSEAERDRERRACGTGCGESEWRDSAKWCLGYFYHFIKAKINCVLRAPRTSRGSNIHSSHAHTPHTHTHILPHTGRGALEEPLHGHRVHFTHSAMRSRRSRGGEQGPSDEAMQAPSAHEWPPAGAVCAGAAGAPSDGGSPTRLHVVF